MDFEEYKEEIISILQELYPETDFSEYDSIIGFICKRNVSIEDGVEMIKTIIESEMEESIEEPIEESVQEVDENATFKKYLNTVGWDFCQFEEEFIESLDKLGGKNAVNYYTESLEDQKDLETEFFNHGKSPKQAAAYYMSFYDKKLNEDKTDESADIKFIGDEDPEQYSDEEMIAYYDENGLDDNDYIDPETNLDGGYTMKNEQENFNEILSKLESTLIDNDIRFEFVTNTEPEFNDEMNCYTQVATYVIFNDGQEQEVNFILCDNDELSIVIAENDDYIYIDEFINGLENDIMESYNIDDEDEGEFEDPTPLAEDYDDQIAWVDEQLDDAGISYKCVGNNGPYYDQDFECYVMEYNYKIVDPKLMYITICILDNDIVVYDKDGYDNSVKEIIEQIKK